MKAIIRIIFLTSIAVLAGLGTTVIMMDTSTRDSKLVPESPDSATALQKLSEAERLSLLAREREALSKNLLDKRAVLNVSILNGLQKDHVLANKLILLASQYSMRDASTQFAAMNLHFVNKDFAAALERVDGVLRAHPTLGNQVFPALEQLLRTDKQASTVIADSLSKGPIWREKFFAHLLKSDPTGNLSYQLISELRRANDSGRDSELRPLIAMLAKSGKIDNAYFMWLDTLSPDDLLKVSTVFDGNFTLDPRNLLFDWTLTPQKNTKVAVGLKPGSSTDRSLSVDFLDFKGKFSGASQLLRLTPGDYTVAFESMAETFTSAGGLKWRVKCLVKGTEIGASGSLVDKGPWSNHEFVISVPQQECDTQILMLDMASTAVLDTKTSGRIYFDSFAITRKVTVQ